jgi:predicted enzyme related to lactoylglutathione lyase
MRIIGMDWAGLLSENYEASQNFLSEKIGLSLQFEAKKSVVSHFRLPSGQLLELYGPSKQPRKHEKYRWFDGHALGFEVDNLESAYQEMGDRGVQFIHAIETWKDEAWCMFLGPENKLFQIQQSGPRSPEPQAENSELLGFSWAGVVMPDFAAAIRFFSQVMEMPLTRREDAGASAQFWLPAGHLFEIFSPTHPWSNLMEYLTIGFQVEDVQQVKAAMEERGVGFVTGIEITPAGHEFAFFRDLDNYLYALWKPGEVGY